MSWMGKWDIRLYFSTQNMVFLPIKYSVANSVITLGNSNTAITNGDASISKNFYQVGMTYPWYAYNATEEEVQVCVHGKNGVCATKMTLINVEMNIAQFQIRMDIMEMLKQKSMSEKLLTFPVSTIQIARFTGATSHSDTAQSVALSIVLCQPINNCDTMFVLPFRNPLQHTVCTNPYVYDLQLHAGEYGSYLTQPFSTCATTGSQNIRFVNAVADALNVNGSALTPFNKDICRTFVTDPFVQKTGGTSLDYKGENAIFYDRTNFFIPFPFSTNNDFQGGLSYPASNINFKLTGTLQPIVSSSAADYVVRDDNAFNTPWVACFLIDGAIMALPDPGSDAAKVIWSDRTVC